MAVGGAHLFPGFLTPVLTQLFFPKPPPTFLTCFCRGERQKYAGKKSHLNWGSNSQPPGHESDTLTTEPPRRGSKFKWIVFFLQIVFVCSLIKFSDVGENKIYKKHLKEAKSITQQNMHLFYVPVFDCKHSIAWLVKGTFKYECIVVSYKHLKLYSLFSVKSLFSK